MPHNVVRTISRPRATAQWLPPTPAHSTRRWYTETDEVEETSAEPSIIANKEQSTLLLRKLDQQHLSQARKNTEDVIHIVRQAQENVSTLPTTVQHLPEIPPYTLGYPRHVYTRFLPETGAQTIKAANRLREHLVDLKYQPYATSDESALANELEALTEDEKRERYVRKKNEALAMEVRLRRRVEENMKTVHETIARHSARRGAVRPELESGDGAEAAVLKGLAEPVVTEGKRNRSREWGRAVVRRSEVKAVDGSDWADAAPVIPIRRTFGKNKVDGEEAEGATVEASTSSSAPPTGDQQADESGSVPVQESASDVKLVDDEVGYAPFASPAENQNEASKTTGEAMGGRSIEHDGKDSAFTKLRHSLETRVSKDKP